jgi:hypothetical protein
MLVSRMLFLTAISAAGPLAAQGKRPPLPFADSSAPRIMSRLHQLPAVGGDWFVRIMRQEGRPQPGAKLDELADSLMQIAMSVGAGETDRRRTDAAGSAVTALELAGSTSVSYGSPYDGALDRLIRIHRDGKNRGVLALALSVVFMVPGHPVALAYVRDVATSMDETAGNAVSDLAMDVHSDVNASTEAQKQETNTLLRELLEKRLVRDYHASVNLEGWAHSQGWTRP